VVSKEEVEADMPYRKPKTRVEKVSKEEVLEVIKEKKLRETVYERHWTRYLLETLGLA